jgi:nicotinate-nucleotide adenylyltransferase
MVQMAIEDDDGFKLSRVDIDRPGPHYAVDTAKIIRETYPDKELIYLMGGDSLENLPHWYHAERFLSIMDGIGVMRRPGDDIDLSELFEALPALEEKLNFVTAPLLEISAEQIRHRANQNRAFRYYLLPKIYHYIKENRMYQD